MKKQFLTNYLQLFFLILIAGCSSNEDFSFTENASPEKITIPQSITNQLKGGELILRKGDGFLSDVIVDLTGEKLNYSHVGIMIKTDSNLFIIHSLSDQVSDIDGVQTATIPYFLSDISDSSLCIVRPKITDKELKKIQVKALEYLKKQIPFDHGFDNNTKDELHCSELVHDVFNEILNKEILPEKKRFGMNYYPFSNFFDTTNFELIFELKPYSQILNK